MRFFTGTLLTFVLAGALAAQQPVAHTNSSPAPAPATAVPATAPATEPIAPPVEQMPASATAGATPPSQSANPAPQTGAPQTPADAQTQPTSVIVPAVSKREVNEAKRKFEEGVKLEKKGHLEEAYHKFSGAAQTDPTKLDYVTAREFAREELAVQALQRGNKAMLEHNEVIAMAEFGRALQFDPTNDYALQRLRDAVPEDMEPERQASVITQSTPIELQPSPQNHEFHFRGDSRSLITQLAQAYGITAEFDDSFKQRHVHFDIDNVNFATAAQAAAAVTKSFWITLSPKQAYFLEDTVENRRQFERMGLQTFYLPDFTDQQLSEMNNSLRVLLNLRFISTDKAASTISIRAELPVLEAAENLIRSLTTGKPEVLLDVRIFAVSSSFAQSLGTALPTQFTMFNISPALLAGLGQNAQNLINQLIASGGINQANSQAISALLAQLQNSSTSSILSQPFVVFGGGLTLFGLSGAGQGVTPTFSLNESDIKNLEHVTLRASHNDPAVMKIGERYPIINATYAPIYNSSSIAHVLGNQSYIAPVPSVNYEDLGVNLKATPWIHGNEDVTLKLELQVRALAGSSVNGVPIIANREYTGDITAKNGESSVVTGLIDEDDSRSITGYPFLARVPALTYASSVHNKNITQDELLVVITPYILRQPAHTSFAVQLPAGH